VIAAGYVVKLVAEISVAIVEINVEEQIGEGDDPDQGHPGRKIKLAVAARRG
jgi:hypothetical protein